MTGPGTRARAIAPPVTVEPPVSWDPVLALSSALEKEEDCDDFDDDININDSDALRVRAPDHHQSQPSVFNDHPFPINQAIPPFPLSAAVAASDCKTSSCILPIRNDQGQGLGLREEELRRGLGLREKEQGQGRGLRDEEQEQGLDRSPTIDSLSSTDPNPFGSSLQLLFVMDGRPPEIDVPAWKDHLLRTLE